MLEKRKLLIIEVSHLIALLKYTDKGKLQGNRRIYLMRLQVQHLLRFASGITLID